jgi:hypothetical protein
MSHYRSGGILLSLYIGWNTLSLSLYVSLYVRWNTLSLYVSLYVGWNTLSMSHYTLGGILFLCLTIHQVEYSLFLWLTIDVNSSEVLSSSPGPALDKSGQSHPYVCYSRTLSQRSVHC